MSNPRDDVSYHIQTSRGCAIFREHKNFQPAAVGGHLCMAKRDEGTMERGNHVVFPLSSDE